MFKLANLLRRDNYMHQKDLVNEITKRLTKDKPQLKKAYLQNKEKYGIGHVLIDDLLDEEVAKEIYSQFSRDNEAWREMSSFREKKLTSKQFDYFDPLLKDITFAIQDQRVIDLIEEITDLKGLAGDPSLYAGGLSLMRSGDFLNPHIDNSHDQNRENYRRLNLLYYVSPNWENSWGGHLELWDKKVQSPVVLENKFNRLVLMETNPWSWHSVSQINTSANSRCCVSNYYFSNISPTGDEYFHVTSFMGRPEEKLKRIASRFDNLSREFVRKIKRGGVGKRDLYRK